MEADVLITGARLVDGTGAPWRYADVAVTGRSISAVGRLDGAAARQRIDAAGRVVCPGFIDIHSHADITLLAGQWTAARLLQGITTEVIGQDGLSYAPVDPARLAEWRKYLAGLNGDFQEAGWDWTTVEEFLARFPGKAANVVFLAPHGTVRTQVMGWADRPATPAELRSMQDAVRKALDEGAAGLSTGLNYVPCSHATTEELIALCLPVARAGGIYATHLRSYGAAFLAAIDEAVEIGRRSGVAVQLSHLRVADHSTWGMVYTILERIDRARREGVDVTFDLYPYTVGCAPLYMLTPAWAQAGGPDAVLARLGDARARARIAAELRDWRLDWSIYIIANAPTGDGQGRTFLPRRKWEGLTVSAAAEAATMDPESFVLQLLFETALNATILAEGGNEADNEALFRHPTCMACSDGVMVGACPHPRGYGAFPRLLAQYVRNRPVLLLEEAINKMTGMPAARLNLRDRGVLRAGAAADVVVLSAEEVSDGATFRDGRGAPAGIEWVLVNGQVVVADGRYAGSTAGELLKPLERP